MILLIDNYDSFTYNLVQYLGELGQEPAAFRNDAITLERIESLAPSHIIISPGPCTPLEAGVSNDVIRHFRGKSSLAKAILRLLPRNVDTYTGKVYLEEVETMGLS